MLAIGDLAGAGITIEAGDGKIVLVGLDTDSVEGVCANTGAGVKSVEERTPGSTRIGASFESGVGLDGVESSSSTTSLSEVASSAEGVGTAAMIGK
jgi:hypothetical protein